MTAGLLLDNMLLSSGHSADVSKKLIRIIWTREQASKAYVLDVSGPFPSGSRMPQETTRQSLVDKVASEELVIIDNNLATHEMTLPDNQLTILQLATRDKYYAMIEQLVSTEHALLTVLVKSTRGSCLKSAATKHSVQIPKLYKLLTLYWWYGAGKNSLIPRHSLKGGKGTSKLLGDKKTGKPNAVTVLEGNTIYKGVNVLEKDKRKFEKALQEYWIGKNFSFAETYRQMENNLYVKWTRDAEGKKSKYRIAKRFIPTKEQFLYHAREIIKRDNLVERKAGHMDWAQKLMSRPGSASDITLGPTDIYDMDVCVLKCITVTDTRQPEVIGNVSICLCIDRHSSAVVGFHLFVGSEKWEVYRLALFWAFMSTKEHLELMGLPELAAKAPAFAADGWCNGIYVDRGPGRSDAAFMTVVNALGLERAIAPSKRAELKAVVESINGKFQKNISTLPGGYSRAQGTRNEKQAKDAAANASLTVKQISYYAAAAIAEHNEFHQVPNALTREMIYDGVPPTPVAIFRWGQKNIRGETQMRLTKAQLYLRLLPGTSVTLTKEGVRNGGATFSSQELVEFRERNIEKRKLEIDIFWDSVDPQRRYWEMPNGSVGVLEMKKTQKIKYEGMTTADIEDYQIREVALGIKRKHKKRDKSYLSKAQDEIIAQIENVPKHSKLKPVLPPSINKKIAGMHGDLAARRISRTLLDPEYESPSSPLHTDLMPKNAAGLPSAQVTRSSTASPSETGQPKSAQAQATSLVAASQHPANTSEPPAKVSPARANYLKLFRPGSMPSDKEKS